MAGNIIKVYWLYNLLQPARHKYVSFYKSLFWFKCDIKNIWKTFFLLLLLLLLFFHWSYKNGFTFIFKSLAVHEQWLFYLRPINFFSLGSSNVFLLTHFRPIFSFYTLWKYQKTSHVFRGYSKGILLRNGFK